MSAAAEDLHPGLQLLLERDAGPVPLPAVQDVVRVDGGAVLRDDAHLSAHVLSVTHGVLLQRTRLKFMGL